MIFVSDNTAAESSVPGKWKLPQIAWSILLLVVISLAMYVKTDSIRRRRNLAHPLTHGRASPTPGH